MDMAEPEAQLGPSRVVGTGLTRVVGTGLTPAGQVARIQEDACAIRAAAAPAVSHTALLMCTLS